MTPETAREKNGSQESRLWRSLPAKELPTVQKDGVMNDPQKQPEIPNWGSLFAKCAPMTPVPPLVLPLLITLISIHFYKLSHEPIAELYHRCNILWSSYGAIHILSQWAWFSMSTRYFISPGQSSAHPLLDDRWIERSGIMRGSYVFNVLAWRVCSLTE